MILLNKFKKYKISRNILSLVDKDIKTNDSILFALKWFKKSLNQSGGSSAGYDLLRKKFLPSYPETTGYWIKTLIRVKQYNNKIFYSVFEDDKIFDDLVSWLLSIQKDDGSFPGSYGDFKNQRSIVFNNGQILLGLINHYLEKKDEILLKKIIKCADWLIDLQEPDGSWKKNTHVQYSSNTRTAWALLQLSKITSDKKYECASNMNIEYSLNLQNSYGIFEKNGFDNLNSFYTHTIAYSIRGLLECAIIQENNEWIFQAKRGYEALLSSIKNNGFLSAKINEQANPISDYVCLVGNCQLSIIGFKLFNIFHDERLLRYSKLLLDFVRKTQIVSEDSNINGGIMGSWPIDGYYNSFRIPNWAGKFFIDALMIAQENKNK